MWTRRLRSTQSMLSVITYAGACLLNIAGQLPDAQSELQPERTLRSPPNFASGYASLRLPGPVLADGERFGEWVEHGHRQPAQSPSWVRERASVVRGAFERKYVRRLRP